ncbi:transglycosylase SLT domain-containing protein [Elusimicrobiota bacterium]
MNNRALIIKLIISMGLLAGCSLSGTHKLVTSDRVFEFEQDRDVFIIKDIIKHAMISYDEGRLDSARKKCDLALKKLLKVKPEIENYEYERLHSEIALLRVKVNQSRHPNTHIVKSDLFPLVWNSRVEKWIDHFTGKGRTAFTKSRARAHKYVKFVKEVLQQHGIPLDLVYVPIVESGYYPFAKSRVGAVGLWQFMPTTGKLNGLEVDYWKDERRDPYKATVAAAKELKGLYKEFGSWELALAAYNYGANGVRRRVRKWGTNDYWELYLPKETENFVPKIMATIFIMNEPELFGFQPQEEIDRQWEEFEVKDSVDLRKLAEWCEVDVRDIQLLNPELKQMCTPPGKKYCVKIPVESYIKFISKFKSLEENDKYLSAKEIDRRKRRLVYYRVRRGDSIWKISKKFNVSMTKLKQWNNLTSNVIHPRQTLRIYRYGI